MSTSEERERLINAMHVLARSAVEECADMIEPSDTYAGMAADMLRHDAEVIAGKDATIARLTAALNLARYWLANCVPTVEPDTEHPLPLPAIDAALATAPAPHSQPAGDILAGDDVRGEK